MKSNYTALENSTGKLEIIVDGEKWQKALNKAFDKVSKDVKVEGFRPGKAPKKLIEKNVNEQYVLQEAVDRVAGEALFETLKELNLDIVTRPTLDIKALSKEAVTLEFGLVLYPEVTLGQYKGLDIHKELVLVNDEEIEAEINQIAKRNASLEVKEDGEVVNGDTAVINFEGFVDGVAFEGGKGDNYPLVIGSNTFIPGFEEQLIGLKVDEEKDVVVTFPEGYSNDLQNKEATFKCKVLEIKTEVLPEINDELAKESGIKDVETLDQLKEAIKANITVKKEKEAASKFESDLLEAIIKDAKMDIPSAMIDSEKEYLYQDFTNRLSQQGLNEELYFQFTQSNKEQVMEQFAAEAKNNTQVRLVLDAIVKAENMTASEEDLAAKYDELAKNYNMDVNEIKEKIDTNNLSAQICLSKALDLISNSVK
ncbi:MAG: trigger factor [Erysipelotrichaceae bacterium]